MVGSFEKRQITITGEALPSYKNSELLFKEYLSTLIEEESISAEQLYNCDVTGLLPSNSLAFKNEKDAPRYC